MKIWDNGVIRDMTPEEEAQAMMPPPPEFVIADLQNRLAETNYQAIKFTEGWITEEEYAPIKAQRQAWRDEINALEKRGLTNG